MPTKYPAVGNHETMDYEKELQAISAHVHASYPAVRILLLRCGAQSDDLVRKAFEADLTEILSNFALFCNAMPPRTLRKLVPTVAKIVRDPVDFVAYSEKYHPEASALVLGTYAAQSPAAARAVLEFELGKSGGMVAREIVEAGKRVNDRLEEKASSRRKGGGVELEWQTWLAVRLGTFFLAKGGKLSRTVFDGESGDFHEFLELVLPAVQPFAWKLGFSLTITTMVAKARLELIPMREKSPHLPSHSH